MKPYYEHAGITIYHGDCREILPNLPPCDLVLTDPPYGISENSGRRLHAYRDAAKSKGRIGGSRIAEVTDYGDTSWDGMPLECDTWGLIRAFSHDQIVWGANHLLGVLGKSPRTLVWDKKCKNGWSDHFSDCEFGWCSDVGPDRVYRHLWMGALRDGAETIREHPTQKPVELMEWCLTFFPDAQTITDPYCGIGPTLIAAKNMNRRAIGIEIEEKYCEIAAKRLSQEVFKFERAGEP